ncbi:MAG: exo-alpha-sialidase [Saprospiraceae bacterium]|nr:exo-alpha-sialidase [Saprospiraceae bacterium]MCZ2338416.1 glycoside hydrolase [Chitinophagales bacterium]
MSFVLYAQDNVPVFISGQDGFKSFRIPAIITMPDGKLLAFAEGRVHHSGDFGDVDIVMKTSSDKGKTWSSTRTVVNYDTLQAGNCAPVLDVMDPNYPQGRIFLFYNTGNNHEYEVRKGNGLREVWYITSTDAGETWSKPVNITTQVHKPLRPYIHPQYNFAEDWRAYANTPGHAIQITRGKYKGRLYIAANHSYGDPQPNGKDYRAHGYYSDDHGKTFRISDNVSLEGGNESMAVELPGGRLMLNIRNQAGFIKARYVALSKDGGQSWYKEYFDDQLPDPVCQGSILRINKKTIAFCNLNNTIKRNNLTLRISTNKGKTWKKSIPIYSNDQINSAAAYSDLVLLDKNTIGILYEKDNYSQIVFKAVRWK